MNIRRLAATVTTTLLALVAGTTAAFAQLPPPSGDTTGTGNLPPASTGGATGSSDVLTWVLVSLAIVAGIAILTAGLRFATKHSWGRTAPRAA